MWTGPNLVFACRVGSAALARHREVIEREFGRRLTPAQHRAVAVALWPWWNDDDPAVIPHAD
jgi:hypothetical protein